MINNMEIVAIILFLMVFILILMGFPVAFTLAGLSIIAGAIFIPEFFSLLPLRIMGTMQNYVLLAVPLFIFMGLMLEKSGLASHLLDTMAMLFGKVRGGLAISVIIVGALLAASTGIVGATVITMGLISLPTMLKRGYKAELATGVICASGTLGQIIPPSIVLVLLGSVLNVPVGDLFAAALIPGLSLVIIYIVFVLIYGYLKKDHAPPIPTEEIKIFRKKGFGKRLFKAFVLPFMLIGLVLGSIFSGIASPTEAAGVGALGTIALSMIQKRFNKTILLDVMRETTHLSTMVFVILLGATTFSLVFRGLGGDHYILSMIEQSTLGAMPFLLLVMLIIFFAGFFIDFIEIIFIIVPVIAPVFAAFEMNLVWIGILIALNLQSSFLSPPFGFALFYLKGVAPPQVKTIQIYKGIIPFLVIQLAFLLTVIFYPDFFGINPH